MRLTRSLLAAALMAGPVGAYDECISGNLQSSSSYFPQVSRNLNYLPLSDENSFAVREAKQFSITYYNNFKVVENLLEERQYILYPCDAGDQPDVSDVTLPSGWGRRFLTVPFQKTGSDDSSVLGLMKALDNGVNGMGVTDRLAVVGDYTLSSCFRKAAECTSSDNKVVSGLSASTVGWSTSRANWTTLLNNTDGFFSNSEPSNANPAKVIVASPFYERSPLARSEWLKFIAAFFNMEEEASRKYDTVYQAYDETRESAAKETSRPMVAMVSTTRTTLSNLYTQGGTISISAPDLHVSAVEDAAGAIRNAEDTTYKSLTRSGSWGSAYTVQFSIPAVNVSVATNAASRLAAWASFHKYLADVDVLIDTTSWSDGADASITAANVLALFNISSTDASYNFVKNQKVYRTDKVINDGYSTVSYTSTDWLETTVPRADLVLKDWLKILHPDNDAVKDYTTTWMRNLFNNEEQYVHTADKCDTTYPICDSSVASYPIVPICQKTNFKKCADGTAVFLSAASGCTKYHKCPAHVATKEENLMAAVICLAVFLAAALVTVTLLLVHRKWGLPWCGCPKAEPASSPSINVPPYAGQHAQHYA